MEENKKRYQAYIRDIHAPATLRKRTIASLKAQVKTRALETNESLNGQPPLRRGEAGGRTAYHRPRYKRPGLILAVVCLCLLLAVPALAVSSSFQELLYLIAPQTAQFLRPIERSCEDQGIRMEVTAAMYDEDTLGAYLTFQDISGARIDDTLDLYDYQIKGYNSFTHELIHYDESSRTATIRLVGQRDKKQAPGKITLSVTSFLSGKTDFRDLALAPGLLTKLSDQTMAVPEACISGGGNISANSGQDGTRTFLQPSAEEKKISEQVNFVTVSAAGMIDGKLHIQTRWEQSVDNHGFIYGKNERGEICRPVSNYSFGMADGQPVYGRNYVEYVFDLSADELDDYTWYGDFTEDGVYLEGDWQVTFASEDVSARQLVRKGISANGLHLDELTISPLGVRLSGGQIGEANIEIVYQNGRRISDGSTICFEQEKGRIYKWLSDQPLDVAQIAGLYVNGVWIDLP